MLLKIKFFSWRSSTGGSSTVLLVILIFELSVLQFLRFCALFLATHVKHIMLILHLHNILIRRSSNLTLSVVFLLSIFIFLFCLYQRGFCPLLLTHSGCFWSLGVPFYLAGTGWFASTLHCKDFQSKNYRYSLCSFSHCSFNAFLTVIQCTLPSLINV